MKRFDAMITTQKKPSPLQSSISDPWYKESHNVSGEKEKCRVVCYDIRHLKPSGPGKVWISPTPSHVSLKFFVLAKWDELVDLGSVTKRPRTRQVIKNK